MAKKKTDGSIPPSTPSTPRPRRASTRRAASKVPAAPLDVASITATEPIDTAADIGTSTTAVLPAPPAVHPPKYEEIAEAAYHRYLRRGGQDGRDFDDWIEAERELQHKG